MDLQRKMKKELKDKDVFKKAIQFSFEYIDGIEVMDVYPNDYNLRQLDNFDEALQNETLTAESVLSMLHKFGSKATVAQTGGRYFGFVNGAALPVSLGVKWLSDVWDQNGGLYLTSPINAKLESVCQNWLVDIFNLPLNTVAGFVSGTSMANLCGLAAARFRAFKNLGWDIIKDGYIGAPKLNVVVHDQVHASIKKTLTLLGFGLESLTWVPSDEQGRIVVDKIPLLDHSSILILQAGNANTGSFDDFSNVFSRIEGSDAWVHIDGAFGLWAGAVDELSYLTKGLEKANSWSVDGHKTLNTPYDSGIILCKDEEALLNALQASGEYIIYGGSREPLLYSPEMSRRSRAIELWACMKYLGKQGIQEMILGFHKRAKQLESGLLNLGLEVLNEVVFNQVLVKGRTEVETKRIVDFIQQSGKAWLGGTTWNKEAAIRVSVCSWVTTKNDIEELIILFDSAMK